MIGTSLQRSKTTGESRVRALVFFLILSVLFHGTFFAQEWLLLGAGMAFLGAWTLWSLSIAPPWGVQRRDSRLAFGLNISLTDGLFLGLIILSLIGLIHPVKASEGILDAIRWFTLWIMYRVASTLQEEQSRFVLHWIEGFGCFIAIIGLILSLSHIFSRVIPTIDGRLASLFGYPNALAAYLGTVLLLEPRSKWVRAILFISLLNTGSRAAMIIFLIVWSMKKVLFWKTQKEFSPVKGRSDFVGRFLLILLLSLGILITATWNHQVIEHLMNWGISTSLGERILYVRDGIQLAILNKGLPKAGGWFAFPLVQNIPYWTTDPHALGIRVLLHQGFLGVILVSIWGAWVLWSLWRNSLRNLRGKSEWASQIQRGSALLFLGVHSLVDADFLFGALGIMFWLLFGIHFPFYIERQVGIKRGLLRFSSLPLLGVGFLLLATTVHPQWIQPEKALKDQKRLEFLQKSIELNKTQNKVRQELARLELEQKKGAGLAAVEEVLAWEKFDLRTYEWAQGLVFAEAEKCRDSNAEEALALYGWVESLPSRITSIREVSSFERSLWRKGESFQPSELNLLLANYAKERQLTLH